MNATLTPDGIALTRPGAERPSALWRYGEVSTAEPIRKDSIDAVVSAKSAPRLSLFVKDPQLVAEIGRLAPATTLKAVRFAGLKAAAPVGAVALALTALVYGFDLAPTKAVARLMPDAARDRLGENVLVTLPISQSERRECVDPAGRAALDALAQRLRPNEKDAARKVKVLQWGIVNAFALPGGKVILTRGILERASGPDEIAGVLAHEIGHATELHPEAGLVRGLGFEALIQMIFTGSPGLTGNVGASLVQLAHNRGFEREADAIAVKMLREAKISPKPFAGFFRRMEGNRPERQQSDPRRGGFSLPKDIFDTHPATPERIRMIEGQPEYPTTAALTTEQWTALRNICRDSAPIATPSSTSGGSPAPAAGTSLDDRIKSASARLATTPTAGNYWLRGEIYLEAKRLQEALADFDKAVSLEPNNASHVFSRAVTKARLRDFDGAIADYSQALQLNPRHAAAHAGRAAVHKDKGQTAAALRDYDFALGINPRFVAALYGRGMLHLDNQRWALAEADFTRVIENQKAYAFAYVRRAQAFEKLGQRDKAIADYREGLRGSPGSLDASEAFNLARARLRDLGVPEQ